MIMRVIDLGGRGYDDGIYDRRGGRGRSRRSDGTYMTYGGGVYDHYGRENDIEIREMELERRERELERRERMARERDMNRGGWFGERDIRDGYDTMDPYPYGRGGGYY